MVETGTANGGSALFIANVCDVFGNGHVATIDIADAERPQHPRLTYLHGSSTTALLESAIDGGRRQPGHGRIRL